VLPLFGIPGETERSVTQIPFGLLMAPTDGGGALALFVQLGLIFMIFYWLLIRPQKKERQRHKDMIGALKKGDEIVTVGGIIGTIVHLEGERLTVTTAENTRLVVERGKVSRAGEDEAPKTGDR
jgi:preprotein translocase subunit YajC